VRCHTPRQAVRHHIETFLTLGQDDWDEERIASHAERELRAYLECGILAHGLRPGALRQVRS